ncbi:MAG: hypothetical protein LC720_03260 [Actinobacteria bacterium]|nr:hypothetical protein [Actinomycetota bacterium]
MEMREGARVRRRSTWVGMLGVGAAGLLGAGSSAAATQSLQVTAAPGAQATRPVAITATGQVGVPSTITIYALLGGSACAAQASEEAARGATLVDQRAAAPGSFSYTASFTPATAGTYSICTYLDGTAPGMTEHQNQAFAISVAPAPPPAAGPAPAPTPPVTAAKCKVPGLGRHTLGGAQHLLTLGGCKLGRVYRPSARTLRVARRRAHGKTPTLVVVSQTPAAGTVWIAGYTVAVRLAVGPAPGAPRRPAA